MARKTGVRLLGSGGENDDMVQGRSGRTDFATGGGGGETLG